MRRCTDLIPIKNNSIRSVINMLPQRCHTMLNYSHRQPDRCVVFLCNLVIMMCEDSFLYYDTYVEFRLQKRCSFGGSGVQYGINPKERVTNMTINIDIVTLPTLHHTNTATPCLPQRTSLRQCCNCDEAGLRVDWRAGTE